MRNSCEVYGLNVEIRTGTSDCRIEVWAGDTLIDWYRGTRDEVLSRARMWFGDGGCAPGDPSPEEAAREEMTEMARWFAFDAPDDY